MARTVIGMSPWPVMNTIGISMFALASSAWKSSPLSPGNLTSSTRQLGPSDNLLRRNSGAEAKAATCKPPDRNRRANASRSEASSSIT